LNGFLKFYDTSDGTVEKMKRQIKAAQFVDSKKVSMYTQLEEDVANNVERTASQLYGFNLTEEEKMALRCGKSFDWGVCRAWMGNFFDLEAEKQPNRNGERHIQKGGLTRAKIWEMYKESMEGRTDGARIFSRYDAHDLMCCVMMALFN